MNPTKEQFLEAIAKIEHFSPAPRILGKAMALLRDPNSSIKDIATLVSTDTALTAQLIRWSNSALYGAGERVSSLDQAVQKIGFKESIRLLNLSVAHVVSSGGLECYGIEGNTFWKESLFNGLFMEELAKETHAGDPGEAHTAGLLRFIGRLAINQSLKDLGYGVFWDGKLPLKEWELENVGLPQAYVGAHLLRLWQFSPQMVEAVECQDEPVRPPTRNWLAEALNLASTLFPPGMPIALDTIASDCPAPEIEQTRFVKDYKVTADMVKSLLTTCRKRFDTINSELLK